MLVVIFLGFLWIQAAPIWVAYSNPEEFTYVECSANLPTDHDIECGEKSEMMEKWENLITWANDIGFALSTPFIILAFISWVPYLKKKGVIRDKD